MNVYRAVRDPPSCHAGGARPTCTGGKAPASGRVHADRASQHRRSPGPSLLHKHPPASPSVAPSPKFGAVWCHLASSPHPLDDDLRGRCAGVKFPLTFACAQQHRGFATRRRHRSSGSCRRDTSPLTLARSAGASRDVWLPVSEFPPDRGRCPSLCQPGLYYGGLSILQSLLASHPLPGAFGYHQCCHRPRGAGNLCAAVPFFSVGQRCSCAPLAAASGSVRSLFRRWRVEFPLRRRASAPGLRTTPVLPTDIGYVVGFDSGLRRGCS